MTLLTRVTATKIGAFSSERSLGVTRATPVCSQPGSCWFALHERSHNVRSATRAVWR